MLDEEESRIEALLRAAAGKRRAESGEPFVLHPADRRRLQQEVAEKYPAAAASRGGWLKERLATLSWGLTTACVLAVAGWLLWEKDQRLAITNSPAPDLRSASGGEDISRIEMARSEASPSPGVARRGTAESKMAAPPASRSSPAAVAPGATPTTLSAPRAAGELASRSTGSAPAELFSVMSSTPSETVAAAAAPSPVARDTRVAEPAARVGRDAISTFYFASSPSPDEAQPLVKFSLTPTTDGSLRVVDDDGSVYTGRWHTATALGTAKEKPLPVRSLQVQRAATARAELAPQQTGAVLYSFTVAGTNREMNAPVTFEGVVFTPRSNYSRLTTTNLLNATLLNGASVSGKVRLPDGKEVPIEARPAEN